MPRQIIHAATNYGFEVEGHTFDWIKIKTMRDAYVKKLNGIYHRNCEKAGVTLVYGVSLLLFVVVVVWDIVLLL